MKHVTVFEKADTFAAWPANNGMWQWGDNDILVGLTIGAFHEQAGHNVQAPYRSLLAKSSDRGTTWATVEPHNFVGRSERLKKLQHKIDFTDSQFAMRVEGCSYHGNESTCGSFFITSDRGNTWHGPYTFNGLDESKELAGLEITARTDYIVESPQQCLLMMSARSGGLETDRVFCARTCDGGQSFQFVAWVVAPNDPHRAVMSSTVQYSSQELISVIRRRQADSDNCWIDAYRSSDAGQHWEHAGFVAKTGAWNGNPPALALTSDKKLCCVYGERDSCRMIARYSSDFGKNWDEHIILRDDFIRDRYDDPDFGYPRLISRSDGKMLACYYWATAEKPCQHIAATIWD